MSVPALYIVGGGEPLPVTVRIHDKFSAVGDIPGLETSRMRDEQILVRVWRTDELKLPRRGAIVSVEAGRAFQLGDAQPADGDTIDVVAVRLTASEAKDLPLPDDLV